ncbi:hypothetical protein AWH56_008460 [Anaerobacillus isosaccharinicus]|uniref:Uncharacterized protein n=1 Tax=Anaerobacillus isosaccharinicus TaxID=1532552 RepID=A0A1S2LQA8_9BACI|nr:hypothetical protein [Anaerobacillus isosaccharinicus]MBA5583984.1 hypothetical protein [Anaerobacillus isosaccharinicus]QOY37598.1 hypothetical protein AWH56_008460 [Anaerobacillus isosaccharinicus]
MNSVNSFDTKDIQKLVELWKGNVKFSRKENKIVQVELSKRYKMNVGDKESSFILEKVITGYNFLKVEGSKERLCVTATVKPVSMNDFENYCLKLQEIDSYVESENNNE